MRLLQQNETTQKCSRSLLARKQEHEHYVKKKISTAIETVLGAQRKCRHDTIKHALTNSIAA